VNRPRAIALGCILVFAAALRLYDIHNPILDHPAWRQGDGAAIARNFYQLRNNIFYPQTDYDGPPPNYVELELQIVPFAAAQLYRVFGIHEIFLRLLVLAFSLATIPLVAALGNELYCARAGLVAALLYAIAPGTVYYGRAVIPDGVMLFFCAGALLWWWRFVNGRRAADLILACIFAALAALAKPPALLILVPMLAVALAKSRARVFVEYSTFALLGAVFVPFLTYFGHLSAIAEWHWASGITTKHVLPALRADFTSLSAFLAALQHTLALQRMLATTVCGPVLFGLLLVSPWTQPPDRSNGLRRVFFGFWFAVLVVYAFVVVTVERVDYYLLPFALFAVVYAAGAVDWMLQRLSPAPLGTGTKAGLVAAVFFTAYSGMLEVHPYYTWSRNVYAAANEVRRALAPGTLIVLGHYDPSVLYTIGHRGWEEDVLLWNVHDMTSAIAKGARYFVEPEVSRFAANRPLHAFMQRYRRVPVRSGWQVYDFRHFALPQPASKPPGRAGS
jgi:4-amino-4-deoxy-L-arabinose transferase-like glycosyltransferase